MTAAAIASIAAADPLAYASFASLLAVLVGYLAGVAVIMIGGQIGKISGIELEAESLPSGLLELARRSEIHLPTLLLALGVLAFLLLIQQRFPTAPGPLLAVLLAVAAVPLFHLDQAGVVVIGEIPAGLPRFALPSAIVPDTFMTLISAAAGIALVG